MNNSLKLKYALKGGGFVLIRESGLKGEKSNLIAFTKTKVLVFSNYNQAKELSKIPIDFKNMPNRKTKDIYPKIYHISYIDTNCCMLLNNIEFKDVYYRYLGDLEYPFEDLEYPLKYLNVSIPIKGDLPDGL